LQNQIGKTQKSNISENSIFKKDISEEQGIDAQDADSSFPKVTCKIKHRNKAVRIHQKEKREDYYAVKNDVDSKGSVWRKKSSRP